MNKSPQQSITFFFSFLTGVGREGEGRERGGGGLLNFDLKDRSLVSSCHSEVGSLWFHIRDRHSAWYIFTP